MKLSSSTPPARLVSQKSSSQIPGFVSPVYLVMLVGGRKRGGNGALRIRWSKAHGPGPLGLGLRSSGQRPCLGCVSPLPSMVRPGSMSSALTAAWWTSSSSCWARCRLLTTLGASWCRPGRSCTSGRCGAGARSDRGVATASRAAPGSYSGERMERSVWRVPAPPVGREGACQSRDAELSVY